VPLLSLAILEAPAPELLRHLGELEHYRAFREMTSAYFNSFLAGESGAIEKMIDFYGGAGAFAAWPQRVRDYAMETTAVNVLDWATAYGFRLTRDLLATVEIPTLVLWGGSSQPAVRRANELLGQCIPGASAAIIDGAARFMIATHARQTAGVIAEYVASIEHANKSAASLLSCSSRDLRTL